MANAGAPAQAHLIARQQVPYFCVRACRSYGDAISTFSSRALGSRKN